MSNVKKIFAVIFAVMAVMLMSTNVFAADLPDLQNVKISDDGKVTWDPYTGSQASEARYRIYIEKIPNDINYSYYDGRNSDVQVYDFKSFLKSRGWPASDYQLTIYAENKTTEAQLTNKVQLKYTYTTAGKLESPQVKWDNYKIYCDPVENAINYEIELWELVPGTTPKQRYDHIVTEPYYDFNGYLLYKNRTYYCYITAYNPAAGYEASERVKSAEVNGDCVLEDMNAYLDNNNILHWEEYPNTTQYAIGIGNKTFLQESDVRTADLNELGAKAGVNGENEFLLYAVAKGGGAKSNVWKGKTTFSGKPFITRISGWLTTLAIGKSYYLQVEEYGGEKYEWVMYNPRTNKTLDLKSMGVEGLDTKRITFTAVEEMLGCNVICNVSNSYGTTSIEEKIVFYPKINTQPKSVDVYENDEMTFSIEAANAETYEWFIADKDDGQPYSWSKFGINDDKVHSPTLTLNADIIYYNKIVWCKVQTGDIAVYSNEAEINLLDSSSAVFVDELQNVSINTYGTAIFEGWAAFANDGYDWRFFLKDKEVSISDLKKYCTVYQPSERKIVFINVPLSLNGLELTLIATNDSTGSTQSSATLNVFGSIDLENGNNVIRRNVYYGNSVTLWFDDLDAQEGVTYTVIYTTPSGTKTSWTNGSPDENWLILNPKYEPYKTMLQAGNTLEIRAEGIDYNKGGQASTDTAILTVVYKPGDIDLNGTINQADAALYLKYLSGTKTFSTAQLEIADVNYDGYKDMRDVIAIMKIADKA